jgi:tetratricopeptide (TPR) repeat protein
LRDENHAALRAFQLAYFWDPAARTLLPDITLLAVTQERKELAVRYALLALDSGVVEDQRLQRQLAALLVEEGELERGAELYRASVAKLDVAHLAWDDYVALFESARLAYLNNRPDEALQSIQPVWDFLSAAAPTTSESQAAELTALREALLVESVQPLDLMLDIFIANKKAPLAQQALDMSERHHPDAARRAFRQAEIEWLANRPEPARRALEEYHLSRSTSAGMSPYQLLSQMIDGAVPPGTPPSDRLLSELAKWRAPQPDNLPLALFYAENLARAGRTEQAQEIYRQLLARQSVQEAYVGLLQQLTQQGRPAEILDLLIEYLTLTGTLEFLSPAFQELTGGEMVTRVLAEAQRRAEQNTDSAEVILVALALVSDAADEALLQEWLKRAEQRPCSLSAEVLLQVGLDLLIAERYATADAVLAVGLRQASDAQRAQFYYYRCEAVSQQQRDSEALELIRQAVQHAPPELAATMQARLGWLLFRNGRTDEARHVLAAVAERHAAARPAEPPSEDEEGTTGAPPSPAPLSADDSEAAMQARLVLSTLHAAAGETTEAERHLVEVLLEDPRHVNAMNDLAYLWVDQGRRLARALTMLLEVVKSEPDNAAYRDSLGWCYYRLGRFAEAADQLRQAAAGPEPDGVILDHLGDALHQLGQRTAARDAWQQALDRLSGEEHTLVHAAIAAKLAEHQDHGD